MSDTHKAIILTMLNTSRTIVTMFCSTELHGYRVSQIVERNWSGGVRGYIVTEENKPGVALKIKILLQTLYYIVQCFCFLILGQIFLVARVVI